MNVCYCEFPIYSFCIQVYNIPPANDKKITKGQKAVVICQFFHIHLGFCHLKYKLIVHDLPQHSVPTCVFLIFPIPVNGTTTHPVAQDRNPPSVHLDSSLTFHPTISKHHQFCLRKKFDTISFLHPGGHCFLITFSVCLLSLH